MGAIFFTLVREVRFMHKYKCRWEDGFKLDVNEAAYEDMDGILLVQSSVQ